MYELLNNCYDMVKKEGLLEKNYKIIETHFIRYIIWLLSFSTKKLDYKTISKEYDKIFKWLEERFPDYKKSKLIGVNKQKGEILSIRLMLTIFIRFHKLHLGKLLVYIYSKL